MKSANQCHHLRTQHTKTTTVADNAKYMILKKRVRTCTHELPNTTTIPKNELREIVKQDTKIRMYKVTEKEGKSQTSKVVKVKRESLKPSCKLGNVLSLRVEKRANTQSEPMERNPSEPDCPYEYTTEKSTPITTASDTWTSKDEETAYWPQSLSKGCKIKHSSTNFNMLTDTFNTKYKVQDNTQNDTRQNENEWKQWRRIGKG